MELDRIDRCNLSIFKAKLVRFPSDVGIAGDDFLDRFRPGIFKFQRIFPSNDRKYSQLTKLTNTCFGVSETDVTKSFNIFNS